MNPAAWVLGPLLAASLLGCAPPTPSMNAAVTPRVAPTDGGWTGTVARVVDGDTFVLDDGHPVRVLGIDSCEHNTPGGAAATAEARMLLPRGARVTLRAEQVDHDRWGRLLRYVTLQDSPHAGQDYGAIMVLAPHTAVYGGRNDAAPAYVTRLRVLDPNGRTC